MACRVWVSGFNDDGDGINGTAHDRLQFLEALFQLHFRFSDVGHIFERPDHPYKVTFGIKIGRTTKAEIPFRAILMKQDAHFFLDGLLMIPDLLEKFNTPVHVFFSDNIDKVSADDFLRAVSQDRFNHRVNVSKFPFDAQGINNVRGIFTERAEALFALLDFLMGNSILDANPDLRSNAHQETHLGLAKRLL